MLQKPFKQSHIVFIPTAANVEEGDKTWLTDDINNFKQLKPASFETIDIAKTDKELSYQSFLKADILVFGGGNVKYLLDMIRETELDEKLPELLSSRIYVGISAGSMVTARRITLDSSSILYYEETGGFKEMDGLGYIDFEIRPHLNSKWFPKVRLDYLSELAKKTPTHFYAIDDNTAIQVIDGQTTVVSEGAWKKFN